MGDFLLFVTCIPKFIHYFLFKYKFFVAHLSEIGSLLGYENLDDWWAFALRRPNCPGVTDFRLDSGLFVSKHFQLQWKPLDNKAFCATFLSRRLDLH